MLRSRRCTHNERTRDHHPPDHHAKAVAQVFDGVKVAKVNTIHMRGRLRRQGRFEGYTKSWKKAVVTLTADSKAIEFFEGMM